MVPSGIYLISERVFGVECVGMDVIQAPPNWEPRIMRYELIDHEWRVINPLLIESSLPRLRQNQPPIHGSTQKAQAWRNSAAWKDLSPLRVKAVKTRAYIVEGVAN